MTPPALPACLKLERPADGVALLTIHRPEVRNALNLELRHALADAFTALSADDTVRVIVLTGDRKAFCAGADLTEYVDATPAEIAGRDMPRLWGAIAQCPKPVIAAVNGYAIGGGCELAMHADIIVAGESTKFGQPEIAIGITPGGGATQRLTRAVGKFLAMRMMLTGELIDAATAKAAGLVSDLVADAEVVPHALQLASAIAAQPPLVARLIKRLVLDSMNAPLDAGLRQEATAFQLSFAYPDRHARMRAFLDRKRNRD
jgi:enoyl-CoA hydratase/carnithine racemase